jgi:tetratricopeptide (TPR) repeat protein
MTRFTAIAAAVAALSAPLAAQSLQYTAPNGNKYYSQPDTGPVARAQAASDADPKNVDKLIALGISQAGPRQMREAIATFTKAIAIAPNNAVLYRWRGHRNLSVREFAKAKADLEHGLTLDTTVYGLWYHLGVLRFVDADFKGAADAFAHGLPKAPNPGELAGSTDWLWMSLSRAGRTSEAKALLDRRPDSLALEPRYAYGLRLKMYRGETAPENLITAADTADVQVATLNFGLGNYYMVKGDTAKAKAAFEKSVASSGWPGFGFIVAEAELARLNAKAKKK